MSDGHRPAHRRRRHVAPIDGDAAGGAAVAQRGDPVEILSGRHKGRTGHVVGVRLVPGGHVHRYPVVILDGHGLRLPHHFTDDELRVIETHPLEEDT